MLVKTYSAAVNGLDVNTVTIEVSIVPGIMYHFTGLGDEAVKEGRNRIAAAMQTNGYAFPRRDITVNMGAEMIVVIAGPIMRMPGLPKSPQAERIDVVNGEIVGLS